MGRIVIPEFQREYVWRKSKAPKLLDSLYRGYPISSLLLWATTEKVRSRRPAKAGSNSVGLTNWLIDGQQRMITLSKSTAGDEGMEIVFNPETRSFKLANAATRKDKKWYRLPEIMDDELYRDLRRNLSDSGKERLEPELDKVRRILDYEIPVVRMIDHSFEGAVEAFTRINTQGIKLKNEDIESAHIAARHSGFIADEVTPFLGEMRSDGLDRLSVMHLFRVCAFVAMPDGRSRTPLHELDTKEVLVAWDKTKRAAKRVGKLLRSEFGIANMAVLWSGALLVPPMAVIAREPGADELVMKSLAAWIALAALLHRYSSGTETALDQDLRACRNADPIRGLLGNLKKEVTSITAEENDFKGGSADRGGLFAMYVACRQGKLKLALPGMKSALPEKHYLLPRAQFSRDRREKADLVANLAFMSDATARVITARGAGVDFSRVPEITRQSLCIPDDQSLWFVDRCEEFWEARARLLAEAFNRFLQESLPNRRVF
jgi:hypothetical protein